MHVGVDGCADGWVAVIDGGRQLAVAVVPNLAALLERVGDAAIIAIDVPVGLTAVGARDCDLAARHLLRGPRARSVFPAPVRACLLARDYAGACAAHHRADGRRLSRQTFGILPKIRDVDRLLSRDPQLQRRIREVHPEVSFARWNGGRPMAHRKTEHAGRIEREALIDATWPGERERLRHAIRGCRCKPDDLNDAFAALWTARRMRDRKAVVLPASPPKDGRGLRMEIVG